PAPVAAFTDEDAVLLGEHHAVAPLPRLEVSLAQARFRGVRVDPLPGLLRHPRIALAPHALEELLDARQDALPSRLGHVARRGPVSTSSFAFRHPGWPPRAERPAHPPGRRRERSLCVKLRAGLVGCSEGFGAFNPVVEGANGGSPYFARKSKFRSFVPFFTSTRSSDLSEYRAGTPVNSTATTRVPTGTRSTLNTPSLTFAPTNWSSPMKKTILPASRGLPSTVTLPRTRAVGPSAPARAPDDST